jgi:hypothetical protein
VNGPRRNTTFCADRICLSPPLGMTTSLTGGEHLGSFGRKSFNFPLDVQVTVLSLPGHQRPREHVINGHRLIPMPVNRVRRRRARLDSHSRRPGTGDGAAARTQDIWTRFGRASTSRGRALAF